ncbi:T6SS immunity protein Tli4 family protein [Pseudocitrobacter cyperus]|uniref:T6SS immunity protein Tli4 family protein n=1 Tax=Pseudocitrobacter cyperus TaxID=3112843 RepID=A0ABV0HE92_9ENTR
MEKVILLSLLLLYSCVSCAGDTVWKNECVGYYQLQLPGDLEVGLYPAERIITKDSSSGSIFGKFHEYGYQGKNIEGDYAGFYYGKYKVMVSRDDFMDLNEYQKQVEELLSDNYHKYKITSYYPDSFFLSYEKYHSFFLKKENRLYQFMKIYDGIILPGAKEYFSTESSAIPFLAHFQTRKLFEIPSGQGFCLPYGFISNDSGNEERSMAVMYRMNNHPDVMILFQDASYQFPGMIPQDSNFERMKNYDAKDYAKWMWNNIYMLYPEQKRKLLFPGWFSVTMDGRKGSGSFLEVTRKDGDKDYGYLAFVRADPKNSTKEPDLQVFITSYSDYAEGHPRISPDELKEIAEHIVSSVKHR